MHLIYYSHSYRPADNDINEFFQELMLSEGMTPSLDPPSDHLNAAKPERHLGSTDGLVAVLPYRDSGPSAYILYEIALCVRAHKPVLVFVEDVLPSGLLPPTVLQRRFSRGHYLREVRNHRHALQMLKTYIGSEPPPTYQPGTGQRSCLVIGAAVFPAAAVKGIRDCLGGKRYQPVILPGSDDFLSYDHPYEEIVAQSMLCVSFVEQLSALECYLLGAVRASLTPTILLTQDPAYAFSTRVPVEYQPRRVILDDLQGVCTTIEHEIGIFEEDYLELKEQEKVLRYRAALISQGREEGIYDARARGDIINIVTGNVGEIDMSTDKINVAHVVGPVNIKSQLDRVTQVVQQAPALADPQKQAFTQLIDELRAALEPVSQTKPADAERVVRTAELVAAEVAKEKPDKGFLGITAEGLKQAAKAVEDIAPAVLAVAAKVAAFIAAF